MAELDDVRGEGSAQIRWMASSVKTPEVAIEISLRGPDTGFVCDHQGRVHPNDGVPFSGFRINPAENLVRPLQPGFRWINSPPLHSSDARPLGFPYQPRSTPTKRFIEI